MSSFEHLPLVAVYTEKPIRSVILTRDNFRFSIIPGLKGYRETLAVAKPLICISPFGVANGNGEATENERGHIVISLISIATSFTNCRRLIHSFI